MDKRVAFYAINEKGLIDISIGAHVIDTVDLQQLQKSFEPILFLQPIVFIYDSVERNLEDLNRSISLLSSLDDHDYESHSIESYNNALNTMAEIVQRCTNLLSSANAFLNFTETKLKLSDCVNPTDKLIRWNTFRRDMHKCNLEYRLMYELRNYSLHCGLPISTIRIQSSGFFSDAYKKILFINISKSQLLNSNFRWKKSDLTDINSLPEDINLFPMLVEYASIVKKIFLFLLEVFCSELDLCKVQVDNFFSNHKIPFNCNPLIIENWNSDDGLSNLNGDMLPFTALNWILEKRIEK